MSDGNKVDWERVAEVVKSRTKGGCQKQAVAKRLVVNGYNFYSKKNEKSEPFNIHTVQKY